MHCKLGKPAVFEVVHCSLHCCYYLGEREREREREREPVFTSTVATLLHLHFSVAWRSPQLSSGRIDERSAARPFQTPKVFVGVLTEIRLDNGLVCICCEVYRELPGGFLPGQTRS